MNGAWIEGENGPKTKMQCNALFKASILLRKMTIIFNQKLLAACKNIKGFLMCCNIVFSFRRNGEFLLNLFRLFLAKKKIRDKQGFDFLNGAWLEIWEENGPNWHSDSWRIRLSAMHDHHRGRPFNFQTRFWAL